MGTNFPLSALLALSEVLAIFQISNTVTPRSSLAVSCLFTEANFWNAKSVPCFFTRVKMKIVFLNVDV